MRRIVLLLFSMAVALIFASGAVLALPSKVPDRTPMIDGRVRAIEHVGSNVWLGGRISRVVRHDGTVLGRVGNLAVLDSRTNRYKPIAPNLGGSGGEVWDIEAYGRTGDLLIAGKFDGPSSTRENLVRVDGATGRVIRWYDAPSLKTVLAAPARGRVYGGGRSLSAFEFKTGKELWTRAKTSVDPTIRTRDSKPAYRDLELDGKTIWAACVCDAVNGNRAKALVKLGIRGKHDKKWLTQARPAAFGESLVARKGKLYLGAGGSDFLGEYDKTRGGARSWARDTSGSTQAVEVMDGRLVIGGHFYYAGDDRDDRCGEGRPGDLTQNGEPKLNPFGECKRRQGIAAYSFGGRLTRWAPAYSGSYSLVWALHARGKRLHTGGQFKKVSGVVQHSYARLSPAGP